MKRVWQLVGGLVLVGAGVWIWTQWFPSPEKQIRKRMMELQELVSFSSSDGMLSASFDLDRLGALFAEDAEVRVNVEGGERIKGRANIVERAKAVRFALEGLEVEFLDVVVTLGADGRSAVVEATGRAREEGSEELWIEELRFKFIKRDEGWIISSVQTVRMLTRAARQPGAPAGVPGAA